MNAYTKSASAVALYSMLAVGSAHACMPMPMMSNSPACPSAQAAPANQQACPVQQSQRDAGCAGGDQEMAARMGSMAGEGMAMAMTMMGAIFGAPAAPAK